MNCVHKHNHMCTVNCVEIKPRARMYEHTLRWGGCGGNTCRYARVRTCERTHWRGMLIRLLRPISFFRAMTSLEGCHQPPRKVSLTVVGMKKRRVFSTCNTSTITKISLLNIHILNLLLKYNVQYKILS